jgi:hypothetical protein
VSSDFALGTPPDEGAWISSGASKVAVVWVVGSADSRDVDAMFEIVEIVAFGCEARSIKRETKESMEGKD